MRKRSFFVVSFLLTLTFGIEICYSVEGSGLEFRLVHPSNNIKRPECSSAIDQIDRSEYECLQMPSTDEKTSRAVIVSRTVELNGDSIKEVKAMVQPPPNKAQKESMDRRIPIPGVKFPENPPDVIIISVTFDDNGSKRFEELTTHHVKRQLAIVLDGQLLMTPVIQEPVTGGKIQISTTFTLEEAEAIAKRIRQSAKIDENP